MEFLPNEDQSTFLSVIDQVAESDGAFWSVQPDWGRYQGSEALEATLEDGEFFRCVAEESLGPVAGAAMVYRLARLPVVFEFGASTMIHPDLPEEFPRPVAVIDGDRGASIRFLPVAQTVIDLSGKTVRAAVLAEGDVATVESLFAYPMGKLARDPGDWREITADADRVRDTWRVAVAAELAGVLKGGCDSVLEHVRERKQFGQALGSFQGVQHRLASSATKIEAGYWLTLRAAQSGNGTDAVEALGYVQNVATDVIYDLHQFMGAMGLTLEHPLHRWTYRARFLKSAMGGASVNLRETAKRKWSVA